MLESGHNIGQKVLFSKWVQDVYMSRDGSKGQRG